MARTLEQIVSQLTENDMKTIKRNITEPTIKSSISSKHTLFVDYDMNTLTDTENWWLGNLDKKAIDFVGYLNNVTNNYAANYSESSGKKEYVAVVKKYIERVKTLLNAYEGTISAKESELKQLATTVTAVSNTKKAYLKASDIRQEWYRETPIDVIAKEKYDAELEEAILEYARQQLSIELENEKTKAEG